MQVSDMRIVILDDKILVNQNNIAIHQKFRHARVSINGENIWEIDL